MRAEVTFLPFRNNEQIWTRKQHSLWIPQSQWQQQQATQQHNLIQSYDLNNMLLLRFFQLNSVSQN